MNPRIYFLLDVAHDDSAMRSVLIPAGSKKKTSLPCDECFVDSYAAPYDFLVQGFEDFESFNSRREAFLPVGPPLMTSYSKIVELCTLVSGAVPVRVGYASWDQVPLDEGEQFRVGPSLGALFITAVCTETFDERGRPLPRCKYCGRQVVPWYDAFDKMARYCLALSHWPGTDLFLIEGGNQRAGVFLTGEGVDKLASVGFTNMNLIEVGWK